MNQRMIKPIALLSLLSVCMLLKSEPAAASAEKKPAAVPIIMYHELKNFKTGKDVVTPYEFESDLKYLKANHYHPITMKELIDYVYNSSPLPEKPIILTFDDGYLSTYVYAYPLLQKYNMKIVLSIIGKNTDDFTRVPDPNIDYSHITWDQLNEMVSSGLVEVQNHSYDLHNYTRKRIGCGKNSWESMTAYGKVLFEDLQKLQEKINTNTGCTATTFTYPYGYISKEGIPIIKLMGFQATLSCKYGINLLSHDPDCLYGLKRICRAHGVNFKKLLYDAFQTIKKKEYIY